MPYRYEFDSAHRIAWCQFEGHLAAEELSNFYREALARVDDISPRAGVVDLSAVTSFEVSFQMVRELANMRPLMLDPDRPRVIIAKGALVYGMARFFEAEGQFTRPNLHVVRTTREACAILGIGEWDHAAHAK